MVWDMQPNGAPATGLAVIAPAAVGGALVLLPLLLLPLPPQLCLALALLLWFLLVATRPDMAELPSQSGGPAGPGLLGRLTDFFAGCEEEPEVVEALVLRLAHHRDRVFIGLLGRWLELPKTWWKTLEIQQLLVRSEEAGARNPHRALEMEAEARRLKQGRDFEGAARLYSSLTAGDGRHGESGLDLEARLGGGGRLARECGSCWLAGKRPVQAIEPLRTALLQASSPEDRLEAAVALTEAAVLLAQRTSGEAAKRRDLAVAVLLEAMHPVISDAGDLDAFVAAGALEQGLTRVQQVADNLASAGDYAEASRAVSGSLRMITAANQAAEDDGGCAILATMQQELDSLLWRGALLATCRDRGDATAADRDLDEVLRSMPSLVTGQGVSFAIDLLRAVKDGDVEAFEEACQDFDTLGGGLASWQVSALLELKKGLASCDLR